MSSIENNGIKRRFSVIIIGAGMAGLSAAEYLYQQGLTDFLVLEASNRCGGRIFTRDFGGNGSIIEAGANWIHGGSNGNCVFNLARTNKLLPTNPPLLDRTICSYRLSDGREVEEKLASRLSQLYDQLQIETECLPSTEKAEDLDSFFERRFVETSEQFPGEQMDVVKSVFNQFKNRSAFHGGDDLTKMSAWGYGQFQNIPGGDVKVPSGISSFVYRLLDEIPESLVLLNHPVEKIHWGSGHGVIVACKDGQKFHAERALITVSLGVLKKLKTSMFDPILPENKTFAIDMTGFGRVGKIFLHFEVPFWQPESLKICNFAWRNEDIEEYKSTDEWWVTSLPGFEEVMNNPTVLVAWIAGDAAEYVEKMAKERVGDTCIQILRRFLNDRSIPDPSEVFVTSWCGNQNILGSYSYLTFKNKIDDIVTLSQPLPSIENPRLLFAGEATHSQYYSTMHGARFSGLREADRILKHTHLSESVRRKQRVGVQIATSAV